MTLANQVRTVKIASRRHMLARFHAPWLIGMSWLVACGARSQGFDWEDDGAGGSSGRGGSSAGVGGQSKGGTAGKGSIGKGGSVGKGGSPSKGGSSGKGGSPGCGGADCGLCYYAGFTYKYGESFPAGDGCNTCYCDIGGSVSCTQIGCNVCLTIENEFYTTLDLAKSCDPAISFNQCSQYVNSSLYCGCPTYANVNQFGAIDSLFEIESRYYSMGCAVDVICEPCIEPSYAYCAPEGRCVDVYF
jgi:hypothetical protein